jgi:hypothetical protein
MSTRPMQPKMRRCLHRLQVRRVDAQPIPTEMVQVMAYRDRSDVLLVVDAMRTDAPPGAPADADHAVAARDGTLPIPATVVRDYVVLGVPKRRAVAEYECDGLTLDPALAPRAVRRQPRLPAAPAQAQAPRIRTHAERPLDPPTMPANEPPGLPPNAAVPPIVLRGDGRCLTAAALAQHQRRPPTPACHAPSWIRDRRRFTNFPTAAWNFCK